MGQNPLVRNLQFIWFGLFMTCFLYAGLSVAKVLPPPATPPEPTLLYAISGVAVMLAVMSFVMPKIMLAQNQARIVEGVEIVEEAMPEVFGERYREAMPKRRVFANPEAARNKAVSSTMTLVIISLALSESVSIFGFVLATLGFPFWISAIFFGAGTLLIALRFPRQSAIFANFERLCGASFPTP